jgi:hypothetical protein
MEIGGVPFSVSGRIDLRILPFFGMGDLLRSEEASSKIRRTVESLPFFKNG